MKTFLLINCKPHFHSFRFQCICSLHRGRIFQSPLSCSWTRAREEKQDNSPSNLRSVQLASAKSRSTVTSCAHAGQANFTPTQLVHPRTSWRSSSPPIVQRFQIYLTLLNQLNSTDWPKGRPRKMHLPLLFGAFHFLVCCEDSLSVCCNPWLPGFWQICNTAN